MTRHEQSRELHRIAEALANSFPSSKASTAVLTRAGLPRMQIPDDHPDPLSFWTEVLEQAAGGALKEGIEPIVREACALFPGNHVFRRYMKNRGALRFTTSLYTRTRWVEVVLLIVGSLSIAISVNLYPTCTTRGAGYEAPMGPGAMETVFHDSMTDGEQLDSTTIHSTTELETNEKPETPLDRQCSRTSECDPGWTCAHSRQASRHLIGSLTKRDDRLMTSMLLGQACPDGRRRVGRPKTRLRGEGQCEAKWHSQDERNCEVDVTVEGELFTSPRCEAFATLSVRPTKGRCIRGVDEPR